MRTARPISNVTSDEIIDAVARSAGLGWSGPVLIAEQLGRVDVDLLGPRLAALERAGRLESTMPDPKRSRAGARIQPGPISARRIWRLSAAERSRLRQMR